MRARSAYLPQLNGSVAYTRTLKTQFSGLSSGSNDSTPAPNQLQSLPTEPCAALGGAAGFAGARPRLHGERQRWHRLSNLPFGRANQWNFGLSASQTIFNPALAGRSTAANAALDRAELVLAAERARAILDAAQAYLDAQLAERLLIIADSSLAQAERTLTRDAARTGRWNAAEFDLLRTSVARDNQRPVVIQRRVQRDQAVLRLRQLLDLPAGTVITLVTPLGDTSAVALPPFAATIAAAGAGGAVDRGPVPQAEAGLGPAPETSRRRAAAGCHRSR